MMELCRRQRANYMFCSERAGYVLGAEKIPDSINKDYCEIFSSFAISDSLGM